MSRSTRSNFCDRSSSSACAPVVGGREIRIALALQAARQRIAVVLVVVDDEQRRVGGVTSRAFRRERLDLRQQARQIDRLGVEVVATRRQRLLPVAGHRIGRQRDHRDVLLSARRP